MMQRNEFHLSGVILLKLFSKMSQFRSIPSLLSRMNSLAIILRNLLVSLKIETI